MSRALSPGAGRRYGVQRVCRVWAVARSTFYEQRDGDDPTRPPPVGASERGGWKSDDELVEAIRDVITDAEEILGFHGEGYRKVWARLRARGVRTSRRRVLRLMRENGLLAPTRTGKPRGPQTHDGTIVTGQPDEMWGTDATAVWTRRQGLVTVFLVVDHFASELLAARASKKATRFEAMATLRDAVNHTFGPVERGVAKGVKVRHDHGSQFTSDAFQNEVRFLGMESSPSFVRAPEGNGVAERFVRTLKEQCLWLRDFQDAADVDQALQDFKRRYNETWLLSRHGYASPAEARRRAAQAAVAA